MTTVSTQKASETNNVNQAATSTPTVITPEFIREIITGQSVKSVKNRLVTGSLKLNKVKLFTDCANMLKSHRPDYGTRLPEDIAKLLSDELDEFIGKSLMQINPTNATSISRRLVPNFRDFSVEEKVTASGKNQVLLKQQLFGVNSMIEQAERKLSESRSGESSADEGKLVERLGKLEMVRFKIQSEIEKQDSLLTQK